MSGEYPLLHIEPDDDVRGIVKIALELDPAFLVRSAAAGGEALGLLREEAWRPRGILLAYAMPGMTGIDLIPLVRAVPGLDRIPFVFLTGSMFGENVESMHAAGAAGVLAKPFNPLTLAREVRELLGRD